MSVAIPVFSLYVLMVWTGTTILFTPVVEKKLHIPVAPLGLKGCWIL